MNPYQISFARGIADRILHREVYAFQRGIHHLWGSILPSKSFALHGSLLLQTQIHT